MESYYLIIKSIHIIAVISWMAGLLYLPRLFVYHCEASIGGELDKTLQVMEKKLLRYIMNPAMIVSLIVGIILIFITKAGMPGTGMWMHYKLFFVFILFASHGMMAKYRKDFALGINKKSQKFYRIFNEVPTIAMIFIVFLAVTKWI